MKDVWKQVRNSGFHLVNQYGEIRVSAGVLLRSDGKRYTVKEHHVVPFISRCGYEIIHLRYDLSGAALVHRLVMESFAPIENMCLFDVNHIDGNKRNNSLSNLEWCTKAENMRHARECGLFHPQDRYGEKHPMCKLTEDDVLQIRNLLKTGNYTQHSIAIMYGVSDTTIHEIKTYKTRKKG